MRRLLLFLFFCIAIGHCVHAQRDSLLQRLFQSKNVNEQARLNMQLGALYSRSKPDSALAFFQQAGKLARQSKDTILILKFLAAYAEVLQFQNRYDGCLPLNKEAMALAEQTKDPLRMAAAYNSMAIYYYGKADYNSSVEWFLKAASILETATDKDHSVDLAGLYSNITGLYSELSNNEKAYQYGLKSLRLAEKTHDDETKLRALVNIGNALRNLERQDTALVVLEAAKKLGEQRGDVYTADVANLTLANVYASLGRYEEMKACAELSLKAATALEDPDGISKSWTYLGHYYFETKQFVKAKECAWKGLTIARENELNNHIDESYQLIGNISIGLGQMDSFRYYAALSDSTHDAVLSETLLKNTQELDAKYESAKREHQIQLQRGELRQKQLWNTILIIFVIAAIAIIVLSVVSYRNRKKVYDRERQIREQRIGQLEKENQLAATQAVLKGQDDERTRLAKDLHDGLGGMLSGIKFSFTNMKENLIMTPDNQAAFERSMNMLDGSIKELRRVAHNMMPESLIKFGLDAALNDMCHYIGQTGMMKVSYQSIGVDTSGIDNNKAVHIYRIVQELINNAIKHAQATEILVQATVQDGHCSVTVEDNGKGFDVNALNNAEGIGWSNIKNRLSYLGGTVDVQSSPAKGTSVLLEFQLS